MPGILHRATLGFVLLSAALLARIASAEPVRKSSVGMPMRIEGLILPGDQLEARPIEDRKRPIVLRVIAVYPHGTAFRYDLEVYGLESGRYDLGDWLVHKDGSPAAGLPELPIEVESLLAPGQVLPHDLAAHPVNGLGGYRALLAAALVVWVLGLAAILLVRRRARLSAQAPVARSVSLAERLKPLVQGAMEGKLDSHGQAELERLLLTYWRRRLDLGQLDPRAAIVVLRDHPEAGMLLRQVEAWLHMPGGDRATDVVAILRPYRDLPDESADAIAVDDHAQDDLATARNGGQP